jgi:alpha-L-fucosidase
MCEWFKNAGLGMFVHWGVYSILGRGEWVMQQEDIALDDYDKLIDQFQPDNFNADEWCQLACEAGAEYVILTTRHHDGVCLFDTKTTDRNTVARGAHRDFIREYADACRRHGLKVGFYYSLPDWSDPGFNGGLAGKDTPEYAHFIDNILPHAKYMGRLAEVAKQLDTKQMAYYEPFYLKEFVPAPSHVKGLQ